MQRWPWLRSTFALLAVLPALSMAAPIGVLTIVEGEATVVRDTERFAAVEGLRLRSDDIVSTGDGTRLTRLELDDGKAVDLGPATQVLLQPRALGGDRAVTLYIAQGWVKLSNPAKTNASAALASARLDVLRITGNTIVRVGKDELWLFAETGSAEALKRRDGKPAGPSQSLRDGDSFVQRGAGVGGVNRLPPADLLAQMPRPFVDTLPRRAARFSDSGVEPTRPADVSYGDVAAWLNGEPVLRSAFVQRMLPRAREPRFRSALVAELRLHPEWQRILFPPPPPKPAASTVLPDVGVPQAETPVASSNPVR